MNGEQRHIVSDCLSKLQA